MRKHIQSPAYWNRKKHKIENSCVDKIPTVKCLVDVHLKTTLWMNKFRCCFSIQFGISVPENRVCMWKISGQMKFFSMNLIHTFGMSSTSAAAIILNKIVFFCCPLRNKINGDIRQDLVVHCQFFVAVQFQPNTIISNVLFQVKLIHLQMMMRMNNNNIKNTTEHTTNPNWLGFCFHNSESFVSLVDCLLI